MNLLTPCMSIHFAKHRSEMQCLAGSLWHNVTLSRRQCAAFMSKEHLRDAFKEIFEPESSSWTAPEEMFNIFKKKKIVFGMLYHCKDAIEAELPGFVAKQMPILKYCSLMERTKQIMKNTLCLQSVSEMKTSRCMLSFEHFVPMKGDGCLNGYSKKQFQQY